jgi:hypothetical protein
MVVIMNNPPAFPLHNHGAQTLGLHVTGMSLRDYFAAKAMQAMETRNASGTDYSRAIHAYEMADAMMKAREA